MASNQEQYLLGAKERADRAAGAPRRRSGQDDRATGLRRGIIQTVNGDGSYNVGLAGADGSTVDSIDGVRPWGDATFTAGQKVFLQFEETRPVPWIMTGAGGDDGGASQSFIVGEIRFFTS